MFKFFCIKKINFIWVAFDVGFLFAKIFWVENVSYGKVGGWGRVGGWKKLEFCCSKNFKFERRH